ncbi:MAG: hypothetical protein JRI39_13845 [Deltaproteobacteria bacterium]|nr:hypothetical protein [Deltaproteobacteria bacterium]
MQGDAICIAGVDVNTLEWIRVVREGLYCMKKSDEKWFAPNRIHKVRLLRKQARPRHLDPEGLHVEDWVIGAKPEVIGRMSAIDKMTILKSLRETDLRISLLGRRSLFLVQPTSFVIVPREDKSPKIWFDLGYTNTDDLRTDPRLQVKKIGISSRGCPCNCLRWTELVRQFGMIKKETDITQSDPDAEVFFAMSLTGWPRELPEEKRKHYLLVAGIHVVSEERIWL